MGRDDEVRVLHVDDERDVCELTGEYLERERERFAVVPETSAADGLTRLREETVDCVVSDYQMPEMDGLAFLEAVRREHGDLPFILFTGKGNEEIASEAISAGVTDYLQKDVGSEQYALLANRIANAVDRHRAERRTHVSQRAMETANEGISLVGRDGTFTYANPAFAELFGYERGELDGEHWTVLYHEDEAERLESHIIPSVRETGSWTGETVRLTKTGDRLVTDHRLADTAEGVIVCTAQDLTEERASSAEQDPRIDLLDDAIDDAVFLMLDHEGYVTRWHDAAEALLGYAPEECLGSHVATLFPPEDREDGVPERLLDAARRDGSASHEGWQVKADDARFRADVTVSASYDEGTLRGYGWLIQEAPEAQLAD